MMFCLVKGESKQMSKDTTLIGIAKSLERIANILENGTVFVAKDEHILKNGTGATVRQVEKHLIDIQQNIKGFEK